MAKVESQMLALGTKAPAFSLPDPDGEFFSLRETANAYLLMFICNHCPFVIHVRDELARIGAEYEKRGVAIYAINSNDTTTYPADSPEKMKLERRLQGIPFLTSLMLTRILPGTMPLRARRISTFSTRSSCWCTEGSWMTAGRATARLMMVVIYGQRWMPRLQASRSTPFKNQVSAATSSGYRVTNRITSSDRRVS